MRFYSSVLNAKKHTNEDLKISKKYYAIFIGLLELQMYIQNSYSQNSYIKTATSNYLPKLLEMKAAAKKNYQRIPTPSSQELIIKVIDIYIKILEEEIAGVRKAMSLRQSRHALATNTLNTVTISAELSNLIKRNDKLYLDIIDLQATDLIGLSNLEMKKEFQRLTDRLIV